MADTDQAADQDMGNALLGSVDTISRLACQAFNSVSELSAISLFEQILDLTEHGPDAMPREARRLELHGLLYEFAPRNSLERMLAAKIVAMHFVGHDRLCLANAPTLSAVQRDRAFKEAMKCFDMFSRLAGQFDRLRSRKPLPMRKETFKLAGREHTIMVDAQIEPFVSQKSLADIEREKRDEETRAQRKREQPKADASPAPDR